MLRRHWSVTQMVSGGAGVLESTVKGPRTWGHHLSSWDTSAKCTPGTILWKQGWAGKPSRLSHWAMCFRPMERKPTLRVWMLSYFLKEVNKPPHLHDISRWLCPSNCYSIYTWHCGMPVIFYKVNNFLLIGWVYRIVWAINNNYAEDTLIPRTLHKHWRIKPFGEKQPPRALSRDSTRAHAPTPCRPVTPNKSWSPGHRMGLLWDASRERARVTLQYLLSASPS